MDEDPRRVPRLIMSKRWTARVSAWAVVTVFLLGAIEAAGLHYSRLMPVQWQVIQFAVNYPFHVLPDAALGFSMPPNQREMVRTSDYTFLFETDANGYPNRDPWPGDPKVVFLGDSLIVGSGVGLDGSSTGLLARMLPDHSILNLGLPGAGPERQARIYRRFGGDWHPDVVVSCLFLASDVENDFHFITWLRDGQGTDYNAYRLRLGRAERNRGLFQRVLDHSLILDRAAQPVLRWIEGRDYLETRFRFADGTEILFERHALEFATAPTAADDPRLDRFVGSMERLRALVEQSGAELLVMLIPSKEELFGADAATTRLNLASRMKKRLAATSLSVLDLYPSLQQGGAARAPYYAQDFHLNAYGHRIVAEEFAHWLERRREIPD